MTTWVHLEQVRSRLAAGQRAQEIVTIRVPRNAPPGEQYGVIWAQDRGRDPAHRNIGLVNRRRHPDLPVGRSRRAAAIELHDDDA